MEPLTTQLVFDQAVSFDDVSLMLVDEFALIYVSTVHQNFIGIPFPLSIFRVSETCDRFEMESIAEDRHLNDGNSSDFSGLGGSSRSTGSSSDSSESAESDEASNSSSSTLKLELHKQNQLRNNLSIVGIPQVRGENLQALVFKVCKLLGAHISYADVKTIRRDTFRSMIIVELRDHEAKAHICRYAYSNYLWSDEVMRLPSGMMRSRIYINDQMTYFYKQMWEIGRDARKKNIIYTSWITDRGFMIKRTLDSKKRYFLSAHDLNQYIEGIRMVGKQQKKRTFDTETKLASKRRRMIHGRKFN